MATVISPPGTEPRIVRAARTVLVVAGAIAVLVVVAAGLALALLARSLPQLRGTAAVAGLDAQVAIERDALGVPTVRAGDDADAALALGFLHAQERFFQMDLLRRRAAGEVAELVGPVALPLDRATRVHRFRAVAAEVIAAAQPDERAVVESYTRGVNAGLAVLRSSPFEYHLLRSAPRAWSADDTVLVLLAMFLELHDTEGSLESTLGVLHEQLPPDLAGFLDARGSDWDTPLLGPLLAAPALPGPEVLDLRSASPAGRPGAAVPPPVAGSNAWAVAASRARKGGAIVASDMHLPLAVPGTWYRAALVTPDPERAGGERRAAGLTLPGTPVLVAGSNGDVGWGFTNAQVDVSDLVILEIDPADPESYRTAVGSRRFDRHEERIRVRGGPDETLVVTGTVWGPVIDRDHRGRPRALAWTAHRSEAVNLGHLRLAAARSLEELFALGRAAGSPPQNLIAADRHGRIGWTILGAVPRRFGHEGRVPASWADGRRGWQGWLGRDEIPEVAAPAAGFLWSANARAVGPPWLERLGDGGYVLATRARRIHDALEALTRADERDLLALQLDLRSPLHQRWRDLLLGVLARPAATRDTRAEARRLAAGWDGRAATDSAGYRLVREFRQRVHERALGPLLAPCRRADPRFDPRLLYQAEGPVWRLVTDRPPHLLDPAFARWEDLLVACADEVVADLEREEGGLAGATWGRRNSARIRHPLSGAVPWLGRCLDMETEPLPGDTHVLRVQAPGFGASARMVVSPGREERGILHLPAGQSGHPLSRHYRDQHPAWVRGEPLPFLPGRPVHALLLDPVMTE